MRSFRTFGVAGAVAVLTAVGACAAPAGSGGDPSISLDPNRGPAGAEVVVTASGFEPDQAVEIGFGPPASEYEVIAQARTGDDGTVSERVRVPAWAEAGRDYVFVVAEAAGGPGRTKLISDPFSVTSPGP